MLGDIQSHDALCRRLASVSGMNILSVDYRKAPEHPWPAAIEDGFTVYEDVVSRMEDFGMTRENIALGGDSAGGNIAAIVARRIAKTQLPQPAAQLLLYPVADSSQEHASRLRFSEGFWLNRKNMQLFERRYINDSKKTVDPDVSPLLASDLKETPPAIVVTAGFDPLRDEGMKYADRLIEAGITVKKVNFPHLIHGFANVLISKSATRALDSIAIQLTSLMTHKP